LDWNSGGDTRKEHPKKQTHVQISVGGLDDSDAEAVNPFPTPKPESSMLTEEDRDLVQGRDLSRQNDVNISISILIVLF
jgi:hypothetical protein